MIARLYAINTHTRIYAHTHEDTRTHKIESSRSIDDVDPKNVENRKEIEREAQGAQG